MSKTRILVIEDEKDIVELITYNLENAGYSINYSLTGEDGLAEATRNPPDLLLLDLMLPQLDGIEICKRLKSTPHTSKLPIIMLTARGEERDIIRGLEAGADDYITKPFSIKVLIARIETILRRKLNPKDQFNQNNELIQIHDLHIHLGKHEVKLAGKALDLTTTEFSILEHLAQKPGWVFTRSQIVDLIRGDNYSVTDRAVDVQIVGLRKKLGDYEHYIETVRGVGYKFKDIS